ncbi:hypothetical protein HG535_0B04790 [Zygotorulaspora mrakii]|uniref:Vacuolar protein sorting-associated protein 35 n=1 Tax=Zygotorulaspora mrakii TaxID=42260 RepID=A0A7H9AZ41_ZYGMR|nr:uncharacterized protein HG535_0B04790 [Zygotorulaspora mrakii]QLG71437.1 hypothetical protein HG535_0B04790 [Zygotorulaspora mrakii]
MSYSETLEQAISTVKHQAVQMQRCLQQRKLMDALKYASIMLTELRKPDLSPKQYYELYILIFDSLSILSSYLVENHPKGHHLADLYELVQYAGNVIPRLYLMITVGTSYLKCPDSPREEILKDMIEMCRGVQNPIRGLFLRYYLSQRTKNLLPPDLFEFNANFVITNFIEMNKLWVRLQHTGPLRQREQRTRERKELQILVGSQLVRLSQIVDDNIQLYKDQILPTVLEQAVQCRDVVSQEYLLDAICQVFPDEFHLVTLDQLLNSTLHLNPEVSINKVILTLTDRLKGYMDRNEDDDSKKIDNNLFEVFWNYLKNLDEERPDLSLEQFVPLIESILGLSLRWYPNDLQKLNILYKFTTKKCKDYGKVIPSELEYLFLNLLTLKNENESGLLNANFYYEIVLQCDSFRDLLSIQSVALQRNIVSKLLDIFLQTSSETDTQANPSLVIDSKTKLDSLLSICETFIMDKSSVSAADKRKPQNDENNSNGIRTKNGSFDKPVLVNNNEENNENESSWKLDPDQEKLAKLCHLIIRSINKSLPEKKNIELQIELLFSIKAWFLKGGKNIKYTFPAIVTNFWKLIRMCHLLSIRSKSKKKLFYENLIKQLFKYASRCINDLFNICGSSFADSLYKLNIQSASLADQLSLGEIAYDFFSQAFTIFEEFLNDSRTQFQALVYMAQALQKTRSLHEDTYYNSLVVRCTLHSSKLLKKQDQCRAVYLCSHLWWATEIALIGEEEGITTDFYREGKRVLECLQRSLRIADSTMDNVQSSELMVEILNRCLYYFIHGNEHQTHVSVKYINGLIELIKTNLRSLKMEQTDIDIDPQRLSELHLDDPTLPLDTTFIIGMDGSYINVSQKSGPAPSITSKLNSTFLNEMIQIPIQHFNRTCEYIYDQREVDDRFKVIVI